jgi:hypothetical protein
VLSTRSAPRRYKVENGGSQFQLIVSSQFCTGLEHGSRGIAIINIRYQETSSENTAGKYSLLDAVTMKRLVKTLQAGKGLMFATLICKVWK